MGLQSWSFWGLGAGGSNKVRGTFSRGGGIAQLNRALRYIPTPSTTPAFFQMLHQTRVTCWRFRSPLSPKTWTNTISGPESDPEFRRRYSGGAAGDRSRGILALPPRGVPKHRTLGALSPYAALPPGNRCCSNPNYKNFLQNNDWLCTKTLQSYDYKKNICHRNS